MRLALLLIAAFVALVDRAAAGDLVVTETRLLHSDAGAGDFFGEDVALDGDRLAVAKSESGAAAVYFFDRVGGVWTEIQAIPQTSLSGQSYMDLEGGTFVVAAGFQIRLYERNGPVWTLAEALWIGSSVRGLALSGDRLVAGTYAADGVRVWDRTGGVWPTTPTAIVDLNDGITVKTFPLSVDVDGDLIVATSLKPEGSNIGQAHVLELVGGTWTETARLDQPTPEPFSGFGAAVSCSATHFAVGATTVGPNNAQGAVDVFVRSGSQWSFQERVTPTTPLVYDAFGAAVDLADGRLAIGAPQEGLGDKGAAYLFTLGPNGWSQAERLIAMQDPIAGMKFGRSLDLDGHELLIGAPEHDSVLNNTGSAWHYRFDAPSPIPYCTAKPTSSGCVPAIAATGLATYTGPDDFVVLGTDVPPFKTGLFFFGGAGPAVIPFFNGTLCVQPPLTRTLPQAAAGPPPCGASYAFPFTQAEMQLEGLEPCDRIWGQWWLRDPANPDGTGVALSNAIEVEIAP